MTNLESNLASILATLDHPTSRALGDLCVGVEDALEAGNTRY